MKLFKKSLLEAGGKLIKDIGSTIDGISTNNEEKQQLKESLTELVLRNLNQLAETQASIISKEMTGNWLQRSWRPITMLTFTAIVALGAFKSLDYLHDTSPFWDLLKYGIGGYVAGRSIEKVTEKVTENIDISFLKKKDRKKLFDEKEK